MDLLERYAALITGRSKTVILVLLVATLVVGSAAGDVDSSLSIAQFQSDSTEQQKLDAIDRQFDTGPENRTVLQVVVRGENVLSKESLLDTLRLQQRLRENETVGRTLVENGSVADFASLVATAAASDDGRPPASPPTLDEQIATLEAMNESEVDATVSQVLGSTGPGGGAGQGPSPYAFLPTDYDVDSGSADARLLLVFQQAGPDASSDPSPELVDAQLAVEALAQDAVGPDGDAFAFGIGIVNAESTQATGESFAFIGPLALVLILGILAVAYRDVLDVVLGLLGIVLLLVWTFGFMGWVGIGMTQILIAVPFLLVGLAIDYALHVVMRYRESQAPDRTVRESMGVGLGEVVLAIAAATVTTAVGFASNLVSPIPPIREFGLVSAVGILSAFVVFGALLPALKVELDRRLSGWRAWRRPAFGVDTLAVNRILGVGAAAARRAPVAVLVVALLLSAGGVYGAANTDTTFSQEDFLPRDTPDWMASLPGSLAPSDYDLRSNADFINDRFARFGASARTEILVEGRVGTPIAFDRLARAERLAGDANSTLVLSSGQPAVDGPVAAVRAVAARNDTVARQLAAADTDGDGLPDRNVTAVYDAAYGAAPDRMDDVLARSDGEYTAARLSVSLRGGVPPAAATEDARTVATLLEGTETDDGRLTATATGQPVLTALVQDGLLRTLVEAFLITLVVIGVFLAGLYRWQHGTAVLGLLALVPVLAALAWLLGSMYLLGLNFTTETAVITSIAIGLGVDYSIHVSERYVLERGRTASIEAALDATIQGTGGALLGSAATTTAGFGVLSLALVPSLQRFGIVTGLTIVYAFLASVVVLPSVLVLWTRYVGGDAR
ncbi:efflux RND transporter permease subunit [Halobacteriales archaeon Cl-PHB]